MPTNDPIKFLAVAYGAFNDLDYSVWVTNFRALMEFLTVILGVLFVIVVYKIRALFKEQLMLLKTEVSPPAEAVSAYDNRWAEIKRHVNSFTEAEWKLAVIEADKFVDDALKAGGYPGESMGERLMLIQPGQLLTLQNLWDAHKLRNLLVHDPKYQLTHRQAILAVGAFEETLRELGALS